MDCFPLCWVCANGGFLSAPSRAAGSVKSFLTHRSLWKPSQETREPMQPTPPDSLFASGDTQRSRSAHPTSWFPEHRRRRGWGAGHLWRAHQWGVSRVAMTNWMSWIHPPGAASGVKGDVNTKGKWVVHSCRVGRAQVPALHNPLKTGLQTGKWSPLRRGCSSEHPRFLTRGFEWSILIPIYACWITTPPLLSLASAHQPRDQTRLFLQCGACPWMMGHVCQIHTKDVTKGAQTGQDVKELLESYM